VRDPTDPVTHLHEPALADRTIADQGGDLDKVRKHNSDAANLIYEADCEEDRRGERRRPGEIRTHALRERREFYRVLLTGEKTFMLCKDNGRDFRPGDLLYIREVNGGEWTGRHLIADVVYLWGGVPLESDWVCMSITVRETHAEAQK